jgi:hypothetical protein
VRAFLESCGIWEVRTAYQSPWQSCYVEWMIRILRWGSLDHVVVLNQRYLARLLRGTYSSTTIPRGITRACTERRWSRSRELQSGTGS